MNKRSQWYVYEEKVVEYLKERWYKILNQNFTIRGWEIDIIAMKNGDVCFVEVKGTSVPMDFQDYITKGKQRNLERTAAYWKKKYENDEIEWYRFDLAMVVGDEIDYLENFLF